MNKFYFLLIIGITLIIGCKKDNDSQQFVLSDSELVFPGIETKSL